MRQMAERSALLPLDRYTTNDHFPPLISQQLRRIACGGGICKSGSDYGDG